MLPTPQLATPSSSLPAPTAPYNYSSPSPQGLSLAVGCHHSQQQSLAPHPQQPQGPLLQPPLLLLYPSTVPLALSSPQTLLFLPPPPPKTARSSSLCCPSPPPSPAAIPIPSPGPELTRGDPTSKSTKHLFPHATPNPKDSPQQLPHPPSHSLSSPEGIPLLTAAATLPPHYPLFLPQLLSAPLITVTSSYPKGPSFNPQQWPLPPSPSTAPPPITLLPQQLLLPPLAPSSSSPRQLPHCPPQALISQRKS